MAGDWEHWTQDGKDWRLHGTDRRVVFEILDQDQDRGGMQARAIDEDHLGSKVIKPRQQSLGLADFR